MPKRGPGTVATNQALAETARAYADRAPAGSLARKAAGCVAVACSTTGTVASARKVLGMISDAEVRAAARDLLDQLGDSGPGGPRV